MPIRRWLLAASLQCCLSSLLMVVEARPQAVPRRPKNAPPAQAAPRGILTTRLKPKQLKCWRIIERLVFAKDEAGQLLHPTLHTLWQRVNHSGHTVYVELQHPRPYKGTAAGVFTIEKFDPLGKHHVLLIRLRLQVIDEAAVSDLAARPGGFIPFTGLTREERYAEVLGHELAHAVWALSSLMRMRQLEEVVEQANRSFAAWRAQTKGAPVNSRLLQQLHRRDALLEDLEAQANVFEEAVWAELLHSQTARASQT